MKLGLDDFHLPPDSAAPFIWFLSNIGRPVSEDYPKILVVTGPPGSGKSRTLEKLAEACGVRILRFSLADTESRHAGAPADHLRAIACEAQDLEDQGYRVIIVIEDAELGVAVPRDGEGSTSNRPQLQGLIQELVDGRHAVRGRILDPKFFAFTTNDPTHFRSSSLREARTILVEHNPTRSQRAQIARQLLEPIMSRPALRQGLKQLGKLSVAEVVSIRTSLRQRVERMLVHDMDHGAFQAWLGSVSADQLIDSVARRVLNKRDLSEEIKAVYARKRSCKSYL